MSWYRLLSNALTMVFIVGGAGTSVITVVRLAGTITVSPSVVIAGITRLQKATPAVMIIRVLMVYDIDEVGGADIRRADLRTGGSPELAGQGFFDPLARVIVNAQLAIREHF